MCDLKLEPVVSDELIVLSGIMKKASGDIVYDAVSVELIFPQRTLNDKNENPREKTLAIRVRIFYQYTNYLNGIRNQIQFVKIAYHNIGR